MEPGEEAVPNPELCREGGEGARGGAGGAVGGGCWGGSPIGADSG